MEFVEKNNEQQWKNPIAFLFTVDKFYSTFTVVDPARSWQRKYFNGEGG